MILESIPLKKNLKLCFEKLPHTVRLIISKDEEEWVCRKEKLKKLSAFTDGKQEHLFKGRLQLFKSYDQIDVQVKNELIGTISIVTLKLALGKLK